MLKPKCEIGNLIKTKDGIFEIDAVIFFKDHIRYSVITGKPVLEASIIEAYTKITLPRKRVRKRTADKPVIPGNIVNQAMKE